MCPGAYLSFRAMTHSTIVALPPQDVLERARRFFSDRVPHAAAFVAQEGPGFLVLRGQGVEEIALDAWAAAAGQERVRAGKLFLDQAPVRSLRALAPETDAE